MKKVISIWDEGFALFNLPEGFEEAQEAHEVEDGFNFLDWPCENKDTKFLGFLPRECWIRDIEEDEDDEEVAKKENEEE